MVDRQFSDQNGVSVAVLPTPNLTPTPKSTWITPENDGKHGSQKKFQLDNNKRTMDLVVMCIAELAGTAILVFLGCMGCANEIASNNIPNELQTPLSFGLAILISVQIFGHISGSHINPMVTVAAATLGIIPLINIPIFIVGQLLGGLVGFGLIKVVIPKELQLVKPKLNETLGLCSPSFNTNLTALQAFLVEFLLSLILVWVCCGIWDNRNNGNSDSVPLRLGLTVAGLIIAGGPYSGANMNPARSFGPALINGDWNSHWIYWVGPLSAGFFGALFYKLLFYKEVMSSDGSSFELS